MDNDVPESNEPSNSDDSIKKIKINYGARWTEVSRFLAAPTQGIFLQDNYSTNLELTAGLQETGALANFVGLFLAGVGHILTRNAYRTGRHQFLFSKTEPTTDKIKKIAFKSDAAYILYENKLYYWNNVTKEFSFLLDIQKEDEKYFSWFYDKNNINNIIDIPGKELEKITPHIKAKNPNHFPVHGGTSTNPLYRVFKTLANFGWWLGIILSNFIGIEDPYKKRLLSCILSDICCFVFGLFAIVYWLVREKIFKIRAGSRHKYAVTGNEGWSKYAKTFLTLGIAVGQGIGGLIAFCLAKASSAVVSFGVSFWGGIIGVSSFLLGLIGIPLINWTTSKGYRLYVLSDAEDIDTEAMLKRLSTEKTIAIKKYKGQFKAYYVKGGKLAYPVDLRLTNEEIQVLEQQTSSHYISKEENSQLVDAISSQCILGILASDDKNYIRNNYTRAGMTLGAGIGACFGLLIGIWFLGPILGGIIFSALGTVISGIVFSAISHKLHRTMHPIDPGYCLYLAREGEEIDLNNIPTKGKKTIIVQKKGQQFVASMTIRTVEDSQKRKLTRPIALHLTIKELAFLEGKITSNTAPCIINQDENKELLNEIYKQAEDSPNSWDYVSRCTASVFGFIGAAIVCLINPAAALLLVPIGTAIAGAIGWGVGILILRWAQKINDFEERDVNTLSWTQRVITGANIGSILGCLLGIVIGWVGFVFTGPASMILAISFFGAVGAILGSIVSALWDKTGRSMILEGIKRFFGIAPPPTEDPSESTLQSTAQVLSDVNKKEEINNNSASSLSLLKTVVPSTEGPSGSLTAQVLSDSSQSKGKIINNNSNLLFSSLFVTKDSSVEEEPAAINNIEDFGRYQLSVAMNTPLLQCSG